MTKNKDKKGKESTIGKIIYGFLLFMPLIAIASAILISTFNKNSTTSNNKTFEITAVNNIDSNTIYYLDSNYIVNNPNNTGNQITLNLQVQKIYYQSFNNDLTNFNRIYFNVNDNNLYAYNNSNVITQITPSQNLKFSFSIENYTPNNNNTINYFKSLFKIRNDIVIDSQNIFYNAVNKAEESNLFNWAKNSIVYTTLVTTCNALSITNTFIPMLLAYWLIISVIYILYDIALMMIIIFHHKVHCLQDSI